MKDAFNPNKTVFFSWKKLGLSFLIFMVIMLVGSWIGGFLKPPSKVIPDRKLGMEALYPPPWRSDFDLPIARSLSKHGVTGCGEFQYRESSQHSREYMVYCTRDGNTWTAYLVWSGAEKVMGPLALDVGVTLPVRK